LVGFLNIAEASLPCDPKTMLAKRSLLASASLLLFGIVACNRQAALESALVRADLEEVCKTQRSFLETRRLMKSVSERDLLKERAAHLAISLKTSLVTEALQASNREPLARRRHPLDVVAARVGFQGWSCPELDRL
jgi:hypothetical protein